MRLYEKKDNLIRKNPNLTEEQKQEIIALLAKHPSSENKIDWNRNSKLTYEDFLTVLRPLYINDLDFRGLEEGKDYDLLIDKPKEKLYAIYTYNASKIIASNSVEPELWTELPYWCGREEFTDEAHAFGHFDSEHGDMKPGAKWCISMQTSDKYWNQYEENFYFVFWIRNDKSLRDYQKIAICIDKKTGKIAKKFEASDNEIDRFLKFYKYIEDAINESFNNFKEKKKQAHLSQFKLNPETGRYDYDGDLNSSILSNFVSEDKDGFTINFGRVTGDFDCSYNYLTSLEGAPQEVGGSFNCSYNNLTSLEGAPQTIGGEFGCSNNKLTSLEGAPLTVVKDFYCNFNLLTSLEGAPQEVGGSFNCSYNNLTSLKGAPQMVGGGFGCSNNDLTSLEGAPQEIGGGFYCSSNLLTSLKGAPQKVGGNFYCHKNQLTSLEGAPTEVGRDFNCSVNHLTSLKGAPQIVGEDFECSYNQITSLEGASKTVGGGFYCSRNKLTSLEGAPREVGGNFYCDNNKLTSLKGAPQTVGEDFDCYYNPNLHSLEGIGEVKGRIYR